MDSGLTNQGEDKPIIGKTSTVYFKGACELKLVIYLFFDSFFDFRSRKLIIFVTSNNQRSKRIIITCPHFLTFGLY